MFEQRSVIKSLVIKGWKSYEIYKRMYDVYGEACFSSKEWAKSFKKVEIVSKMKKSQAGSQWRVHLKWWIQLIRLFWLRENLQYKTFLNYSKYLKIPHKIMHNELDLSKVSCRYVSPVQCKTSYNCKNSRKFCQFGLEQLLHPPLSLDLVLYDFHWFNYTTQ